MKIINNVLISVNYGDIKNGEFIIPSGVTRIGRAAFYNCRELKSIMIPDSVTSIGWEAFCGCQGLTSVIIGDGVKHIEERAFAYCVYLRDITIPDSVRIIEEDAFFRCDELVTKIKAYKAFKITPKGKFKCIDKTYEPGKLHYVKGELNLCRNGIHYCTNLFEIFDYYFGRIDVDIAIFEIEPGKTVLKSSTSKCCTNSCRLVKRLYRGDVIKILNGEKD